jgi:hypothetical protein
MSQFRAPDWSDASHMTPGAHAAVVVTEVDPREDTHIKAARTELGRRLAAFKGCAFLGEYDPSAPYSGRLYFIPGDTLLSPAATALGIESERDLFGGVVPFAFVATKAITHALVGPDAAAPAGWSHEFGQRVRDAVLAGFTAFSHEDARAAGARLLDAGPTRTKPPWSTAGRDQTVVRTLSELDAVLDAIDTARLAAEGLVIEEHLSEVRIFSVGQVRVADVVATYCGTQRLTTDNRGQLVYGGSDLFVTRGDFEALLGFGLSDDSRLAVSQARAYDAAASSLFPGWLASRRNYDVAQGLDARGHTRSGVLEQSWRMGGASAAEMAALEAFRADPALQAVNASTFEAYGGSEPPPGATVYFHGIDERIGPVSRYVMVQLHDS